MRREKRQDWQRFWWHPIFGPLIPMAIIIGLVIGVVDLLGLPLR
jgi:hypothetical protein